MKVKDVMTKHLVTIDPEASVATALDVMRSKHIRHLPVLDGAGALVGVITDRDLRHAAFAPAMQEYLSVSQHRRARQLSDAVGNLRVRDLMTWTVITTGPEAPLMYAALIMFESRVGSLPVLEGTQLVGLLTEQDVMKALMLEGKITEFGEGGYMW